MRLDISIERLDDGRLQVTATDEADEWGGQESLTLRGSVNDMAGASRLIGSAVTHFVKVPLSITHPSPSTLNLGPVSAGPLPAPSGEIGKGSLLDLPDETPSPATSGANIRGLLDAAVQQKRSVVIRYTDSRDTTTEREVRPIQVERKRFGGQVFGQDYLMAYDPEKDGIRSFKLDRISRVEWAS